MGKKQRDIGQLRDLDTDVMRIVAAFFVVMIHASDLSSWAGICCNTLARFSVPVFVIISGYYMLERKNDVRTLAGKCIRLFLLMLVWSGIYYADNLLTGAADWEGIRPLLTFLLTEPIHLWYLYAAIALYLFTPLLYVFCRNASGGEYRYALAVTFVLGSLVTILQRAGCFGLLSEIVDKMKIPCTLGFIFLYLSGDYLRRYGIQKPVHRCVIYILGITGTAAAIAGTGIMPDWGIPDSLLLSFFAPNAVVAGIAFFLWMQQIFSRIQIRSLRLRKAVGALASGTLGIYLLHPLIISIMRRSLEPSCFSDIPAIMILQQTASAYLLSAAAALILKCIPLLKRLV